LFTCTSADSNCLRVGHVALGCYAFSFHLVLIDSTYPSRQGEAYTIREGIESLVEFNNSLLSIHSLLTCEMLVILRLCYFV
jgi:hypothetical protein